MKKRICKTQNGITEFDMEDVIMTSTGQGGYEDDDEGEI